MNPHVRRFYRKYIDEDTPIRLCHEVIALHDSPDISWENLSKKASDLPKGWYELARLKPADRVEFMRDFWLTTLSYVPHIHSFLHKFFSQLDDVGVYVTQLRYDSPFESEIVYSLRNGTCFFHGSPPASEQTIQELKSSFRESIPEDYLGFLKIHDGFSKHTDTGIVKTRFLKLLYQQLQHEFLMEQREIISLEAGINPKDLIPFYESFGDPTYQCFYTGWTPSKGVGNVYYSSLERTISDVRNRDAWLENLAFPTFLDWLIFYLEGIEF